MSTSLLDPVPSTADLARSTADLVAETTALRGESGWMHGNRLYELAAALRARGVPVCRVCFCSGLSPCEAGCKGVRGGVCASCDPADPGLAPMVEVRGVPGMGFVVAPVFLLVAAAAITLWIERVL